MQVLRFHTVCTCEALPVNDEPPGEKKTLILLLLRVF
jgi:hypothetical protein